MTAEELEIHNKRRMIFLALLNQAMAYREGFFREDVELFEQAVIAQMDKQYNDPKVKKDSGWQKRAIKKVKALTLDYDFQMKKFNNIVYKEIEETVKNFDEKQKAGFDNYSAGFGSIMEHYVNAKSTVEIISVCNMYNTGHFDAVFEKIKEGREKPDETVDPVLEEGAKVLNFEAPVQPRVVRDREEGDKNRPENIKDVIDTNPPVPEPQLKIVRDLNDPRENKITDV